jgi:glutamate N-acetyltransferase/amino-acid N-acetyltransferase
MPQHKLPHGYRFAATASGIKKSGKPDLGLIVSDQAANCAGVYTRNQVIAAPLQLTKLHLASGRCQAILVNSGNANACTGHGGLEVARACGHLVATNLQIDPQLVALASTGVIGQPLPLAPFERAVPGLTEDLRCDAMSAVAEAMRTTDRYAKIASAQLKIGGQSCRIVGLAKGAGMIHPDMATMLAFVLTDAELKPQQLQRLLNGAVERSFNSITVDGDTSTNDMVLLLANGAAEGVVIDPQSEGEARFARELDRVLLELAKMIVRDGEGATKVAEILVCGAESDAGARQVARAVATSSLVKTAFFGEDANWGRIIAAVGYAGVAIDPALIDIFFDQVQVVRGGLFVGSEVEAAATAVLKQPEFCVRIDLHQAQGSARYYTSDLTYDYVKINADYRT